MSKVRFPQLVAELTKKRTAASLATSQTAKSAAAAAAKESSSNAILPSLGASGAIYGTVTLTALAFPDTEIALLFPPTFPIPIQWGVGGIIALDLLGALRGWRYVTGSVSWAQPRTAHDQHRFFDHYAHLGGAAFGALYYLYGPRIWDTVRLMNLGAPTSKPSHTTP